MTRTTKMTEQLNWRSYKETYFIGNRVETDLARDPEGKVIMEKGEPKLVKVTKFVNELKEAIDNGEFDKLVQECADLYHDGDVQGVYYAMKRNLDSQACNMRKRAYAPNATIDKVRLETMEEYVNSKRESKARAKGLIPQWAYGPTEIDQIDDPAKLQKIINSINDVASDAKANKAYAERLGDDYKEVAKANREYARKRKAELEAKTNAVDPDLLSKLGKGSKVTLTPEQAAELFKLLGSK